MEEKNNKKRIVGKVIFIISIFVILFSITYAFVIKTVIGSKKLVINAGVIDLLLEEENEITISDAYPMYDEVGMIQEDVFKFRLVNKGEMSVNYQLKLADVSTGNSLSKNIVRYGLTKNGNTTIDYVSTQYIDSGIIEKGETYNYELRLWISDKVVDESKIANKSLSLKIEVKTGQLDETKYVGMLQARKDTDAFWKYKESITSVVFENEISVPEEGIEESWDVSTAKDGSVMAYIEDDGLGTETYKLHIQGNDVIYANINSSSLFYGFKNTASIEGLEYFDTSNVTNMYRMFCSCNKLAELDLSNFDTSNVTYMYEMFIGCSSLKKLNLNSFNTMNVTNMAGMFNNCSTLTELDVSSFDTSNVTHMYEMFKNCGNLTQIDVSNFNTENVKSIAQMFKNCNTLTELDLSNFNTFNVTDMASMFYNCSNLTELDLSNFNTFNVTDMASMFCNCSNLTELDVSNFDTTKVTNMGAMFYNCSNLIELDVSNFNTSNVSNMDSMFSGCKNLIELDVSNFDTTKVTNMGSMFYNCSNLTKLNVSNFDTSKVASMARMFRYCSNLTVLDISNWNTSNVTNMGSIFNGCNNLTTEITIRGNVTSYSTMFSNAATSTNAKITVNYTADTSLLVDEMLKTKSTNSNVVKGKEEKPLTPQE